MPSWILAPSNPELDSAPEDQPNDFNMPQPRRNSGQFVAAGPSTPADPGPAGSARARVDNGSPSAADTETLTNAELFIGGCTDMVQVWESGALTDSAVVEGLIKWCDDAEKHKVVDGPDRMLNQATAPTARASTDPDLYRVASRKRTADGSPHSDGV
jgi:hypothetical protein